MFNILIVEDEVIQRQNLVSMASELGAGYKILEAGNVLEAYDLATNNNIDLFLIDVHLEDESGINLALKFRALESYSLTWIVFITTQIQFMLEAFINVHCYDYLIKPIEKEMVLSMIKTLLNENKAEIETEKCLRINMSGVFIKIFPKDIFFIETYMRTVKVHTREEVIIVKNMALSKILDDINCDYIIQSHKSFAVNIKHINKIVNNGSLGEIHFYDYGEVALLGEKYHSNISNVFKQNEWGK